MGGTGLFESVESCDLKEKWLMASNWRSASG